MRRVDARALLTGLRARVGGYRTSVADRLVSARERLSEVAAEVATYVKLRQTMFLGLFVLLIGLAGIGQSYYEQKEDERQDREQTVNVKRNSALIDCLVDNNRELRTRLDQQTALFITDIDSEDTTWKRVARFLKNPPPGGSGALLVVVDDHRQVLAGIKKALNLNPYPNIEPCLRNIGTINAVDQLDVMLASDLRFASHVDLGSGPRTKCFGRKVTIRGTRVSDLLIGTDGPDTIISYGGGDLIVAGGGRDRICSGRGSDTVNGGQGYDRAHCGPHRDRSLGVERPRRCE